MKKWLPPGIMRRLWNGSWRFFRSFLRVCLLFLIVGTLIGLFWHAHYDSIAAGQDFETIRDMPQRIEVVDSNGKPIGSIPWSTSRRSLKSLDEVSPILVTALLRMEDRGFYDHGGVNWKGVGRAIKHDVKTLSLEQGGSGITQQLAKMWKWGIPQEESACEKFDRKFLEWHLARWIERHLTKEEILAAYLDRIDFGGGFHGVYAASEGFFGKLPKDLSPEEAATLVAIVRGPGMYSPITHPEACKKRRDLVLRELVNAGKLSGEEAARFTKMHLETKHREWAASQRGTEETRLASRELRKIGIPNEVLNRGGFTIRLTIDREWDQRVALATAAHFRQLDPRNSKRPLQAAALVFETNSGAIKVLQTGRGDLPGDWVNRVFDGQQQLGSVVKPFLYELAFEAGISPQKVMRNDGLDPEELGPGVFWFPRNAGHRGDRIPVREGLIHSQNCITVRVGMEVGLAKFADRIQDLGIAKAEVVQQSPTSFIGSFSSSVAEITRAFTIFRLNGHLTPKLHIIERIEGEEGAPIYTAPKASRPLARATASNLTRDCLAKVFTEGTAKHAKQTGRDWIGKTGTTNGARDNWFVGSDPQFTCGVWVGCDIPTTLHGASGGKFALPLWVRIMQEAPTKNELVQSKR